MKKYFCYFCDEPTYSHFMDKCNDIYVCEYSCGLHVPINNAGNGECGVCLENKSLIKLPNCIHTICLECCKTIYFGTSYNERPNTHWRDDEGPEWPFDFDDDNENDPVRVKWEEYQENDIFNICSSYEEFITIRDNLIPTRSEWMNEEVFINYESANFLYHTNCVASDKLWDTYKQEKTKGNSMCPFCRA